MPSIVFNHLIRELYHKKCSIINFLKKTDKFSEIHIFNTSLTDNSSGLSDFVLYIMEESSELDLPKILDKQILFN